MNKYEIGDKITFDLLENLVGTIISSSNNRHQIQFKDDSIGWFSEDSIDNYVAEVEKPHKVKVEENNMDIKSGDKVTVEFEVSSVYEDDIISIISTFKDRDSYILINKKDIVSHTPKKREIKVGYIVKPRYSPSKYIVVAIYENRFWCKVLNSDTMYTFDESDDLIIADGD